MMTIISDDDNINSNDNDNNDNDNKGMKEEVTINNDQNEKYHSVQPPLSSNSLSFFLITQRMLYF